MKSRIVFAFAVMGLAIASAKSYTLTLYSAATVGGTELKPGQYSVEVKDSKAVIRNGHVQSEAPVKVESVDSKYGATTVRYGNDGGKMQIQEIRLGGTNTKLVFTGDQGQAGVQ
jgi:hypothetical protein